VAAANLQQSLDDLAKAVGVRVASAETLPAEAAGTWQAIPVRVTLTASWPALVQLLKSIATAPTTMVVDNLQLRPPPPGSRDPERLIETAFSVTSWRVRDGGTP
jgi:general secretion pathway protein M